MAATTVQASQIRTAGSRISSSSAANEDSCRQNITSNTTTTPGP